ncbi:MAG: saccharopine dehydrogenase NADP-binding domain-containing protein, partial [Steroidobacteraceae bacterium]
MHSVLVLGAGKIGALISGLLAESGSYRVHLADVDGKVAQAVVGAHGLSQLAAFQVDARQRGALREHLRAHPVDAVVSSLPYYCNIAVAAAAREAGAHYFDLTEDVEVTREVRRIATGANRAFVPQCGLAPGVISIAAHELMTHFDEVRSVKLRVGALPQHPNNVLKYSLTWSTEGLINEYGNPCQAIVDGCLLDVAPLEGLEEIEIDGTLYEAFNTSGGLGSLGESFGEKCESMNYKTIRYPGHCAQMRLLMNDLKLNQDRDTLKRILENA